MDHTTSQIKKWKDKARKSLTSPTTGASTASHRGTHGRGTVDATRRSRSRSRSLVRTEVPAEENPTVERLLESMGRLSVAPRR